MKQKSKKKRIIISLTFLATFIVLMILYYIGAGIIAEQNKIKKSLKKYKQLDGLKFYYSKLPLAIYTDEKLPPQENFAIVLMQKKQPIIAKVIINNSMLNYSLSCEKFRTDIACKLRNNKLILRSMSYANRILFDFNSDMIWDFRKITKGKDTANIFLNGKWVSCIKVEGKIPNLTVSLKSGKKYNFNIQEGIWQKL